VSISPSDWTDTLSARARLGEERFAAWQTYRQVLRGITLQEDPYAIDWPDKKSRPFSNYKPPCDVIPHENNEHDAFKNNIDNKVTPTASTLSITTH
jgi:hypothetical protein